MPLRVLVVDDEPFIRMNLVDAIAAAGMEADEAADADEAMVLLNSASYDLVISDVRMPGSIDGRELVRRVRARWSSHVILMSGHFEGGDVPLDILCIRKPFSVDSLVARLPQILGRG